MGALGLAAGLALAGCNMVHGGAAASSEGGGAAAAGITLPLPGDH